MPIPYILSATAFELQVETAREITGSQSQKYSLSGLFLYKDKDLLNAALDSELRTVTLMSPQHWPS